jgi:poly-gamma-glutamate synthesis protein (capsule biosynthesis protein)
MQKNILFLFILIFLLVGLIAWQLLTGTDNFEIKNLSENKPVIEETRPLKFILVGDIMLDRKVESLMKKNGNFYPFMKISEFLNKSDGVFGNLEGPIVRAPKDFSDASLKFAFGADVTDALFSANFRVLSLANNHVLNMDQSGLEETKQFLEKSEIDWVGEPWECSNKISVKDNLVFIAFNKTFSGCADEKIIEIIESIKDSGPEKFLIVGIHWGDEYKLKSNQIQRDLAHGIIDAGADLIIGHHPHVVQEIERYNNKLIFYSLGNFIFDQYFSEETQEGLMVGADFYPDKVVYNLIPVKSELSQPALMSDEESKIFFEKRGLESIIEIRKENRVCFKENCFLVEIADTAEERTKGLMYRENLAGNRGMLFIFSKEGLYSFWMKNTLIPLDIIWLNQNKEVVFMAKNSQPCGEKNCTGIKPDKEAKYVLEINGGLSDKINLKIGDRLIFDD